MNGRRIRNEAIYEDSTNRHLNRDVDDFVDPTAAPLS